MFCYVFHSYVAMFHLGAAMYVLLLGLCVSDCVQTMLNVTQY